MPGKKSDSNTSMGNQRIEYGSLIDAKIRVFEYEPSMMHAKTFVVDDELAMVSSINFDVLSLDKLEEDALVIQDRPLNEEMARSFEADCAHAACPFRLTLVGLRPLSACRAEPPRFRSGDVMPCMTESCGSRVIL